MLVGIAVNNGIVLVEFYESAKDEKVGNYYELFEFRREKQD
jgi:multidrug efflux pump subunit AcrB